MRFWLTLILGTIAISGILSWLYLRMEAAPYPAIQLQSDKGVLPRVEFPGHTLAGDPKTVALQHGQSHLDVEYRVSVPVANRGAGELVLTVGRKTCGCIQNVFLDDASMPEGLPMMLPPGSEKQIHITWKYSQGAAEPDRDRRFAVEFLTNDPETPVFRVEVSTHVVR